MSHNYESLFITHENTYIQFRKTYYGEFIRNLKIKYEYNMDDRPIFNIQTFLGIFKLILAKLIKKSARLEEIEISDFRFSYSEYWNTPEKDENHAKYHFGRIQTLLRESVKFSNFGKIL